MYKNILVPISFDADRNAAAAIEAARVLADTDGSITLLHVIERIPDYVISYMPEDYLKESHRALATELAEMAKPVPNASAIVISGHSGKTILEWADKNGVDCIVVAGHRPGMQDLLLGSTATQVVRHAKCAVLVIR